MDPAKEEWKKYGTPEEADTCFSVCTVSRKGIKPEEMLQGYEEWLAKDVPYEQSLLANGYSAPRVTAASLAASVPEEKRSSYKVLDVAAGTGLAAMELRKLNFQCMDALDPSEAMLAKAKDRNLYQKYYCEFVTAQRLPIEDGSYDAVTVSAGFTEGHMRCESLHELIRLVKPGGFIVIVSRPEYLQTVDEYRDRLEPLMKTLEDEGKWQQVERKIYPQFYLDKEGIMWKYRVS